MAMIEPTIEVMRTMMSARLSITMAGPVSAKSVLKASQIVSRRLIAAAPAMSTLRSLQPMRTNTPVSSRSAAISTGPRG